MFQGYGTINNYRDLHFFLFFLSINIYFFYFFCHASLNISLLTSENILVEFLTELLIASYLIFIILHIYIYTTKNYLMMLLITQLKLIKSVRKKSIINIDVGLNK